ncbi:MAG: GNAT family N-acetyltransferase [Firmicutes bacterium]|nr:GNAT family N-acetyltransferase [Bacillota bacterium]
MPEQNITFTVATNHDIEAICEFELQARITEPDVLWDIDLAAYKQTLFGLDLGELTDSKIVIAKGNRHVIGRCDLTIMFSLLDCEKVGYIDWIYTLKGFRGNGVGKGMIKKAEEYFKNQDVRKFFLFTATNKQAQRFYHRQSGFIISNKEVAEKDLIKA